MEVTTAWEGGLAGQHRERTVDTTVGRRIELLVEESGFFELPEFLGGHVVYDGYTWSITVVDGERRHSVWWGMEATLPPKVAELLDVVGTPPLPGLELPVVELPGDAGNMGPGV